MVGEDGRTLVEPVGVDALDSRRHGAVGARSPLREQGCVGDLLRQRVPELVIAATGPTGRDDHLGAPE